MSETETVKRGPGRPPRQEEVQQRRRRREGLGLDRNLKLHVSDSMKDDKFVYRWVNDKGSRVQYLTTEDDWDVVSQADSSPHNVSEGTTMRRVGNQTHGDHMVLLRKPREYYEADKAQEQKAIDAMEEGLRKGNAPSAEALAGPHQYTPGGRNTIARG